MEPRQGGSQPLLVVVLRFSGKHRGEGAEVGGQVATENAQVLPN